METLPLGLKLKTLFYMPLHLENEQAALLREFKKYPVDVYTFPLLDPFDDVVDIARKRSPDVCLLQIQGENQFDRFLVQGLKETGAFLINFNGDVRVGVENCLLELGKMIDLTLITNRAQLHYYDTQGVNVLYWQITYDPEVFKPLGLDKTQDVAFFGSSYPHLPGNVDRIDLVKMTKENFEFRLYGSGWNGLGVSNPLDNEETAEAINRTKIVLGISAFNEMDCYTSDRLFRTMGSGTFYLTKRFPGLEKMGLRDGKHLATFDTTKEAFVKIGYYLANEGERERIAEAGYAQVRRLHGPERRVKEFWELLKWEI